MDLKHGPFWSHLSNDSKTNIRSELCQLLMDIGKHSKHSLSQFDVHWDAHQGEFSAEFDTALAYAQLASLWTGYIVFQSSQYQHIEKELTKTIRESIKRSDFDTYLNYGPLHSFDKTPYVFRNLHGRLEASVH